MVYLLAVVVGVSHSPGVYDQLTGDAADSSIVVSDRQVFGTLGPRGEGSAIQKGTP